MCHHRSLFLGTVLLGAAATSFASILDVPGQFSSISTAISATQPGDTVLIHPGTYFERLDLPAHDLTLTSEYLFTGDTICIAQTVVDASPYAEEDTACVLCAHRGSTRATLVSGLTLTGGHGVRNSNPEDERRWGGGLHIKNSNPVISHCRIVGNRSDRQCAFYAERSVAIITHCEIAWNCGAISPGYFFFNSNVGDSAEFTWNDVHDNFGCMNLGPLLFDPGIGARESYVSFRYNNFHDYSGYDIMAIEFYRSHGAVIGNRFERIEVPPAGLANVVMSTLYAHTISDNVFRGLDLADGQCIALSNNGNLVNPNRSLLERNWFEGNVCNYGANAIWMSEPNAEIRGNVIINCVGRIGALQISQTMAQQGCDVVLEFNYFGHNTGLDQGRIGSAFDAYGVGPPCTVRNNWFEGNNGIAVEYDLFPDTFDLDMTYNYWGDPTGPYHPIENPQGRGDTVGADIRVSPWLTEPPEEAGNEHGPFPLIPGDWTLTEVFPNPFNASVNIRIVAQKPQPFEVSVYNTLGQHVSRVWQGVVPQNAPTLVRWDGKNERGMNAASGVYYLVAQPRGPLASAPKAAKAVLLR